MLWPGHLRLLSRRLHRNLSHETMHFLPAVRLASSLTSRNAHSRHGSAAKLEKMKPNLRINTTAAAVFNAPYSQILINVTGGPK